MSTFTIGSVFCATYVSRPGASGAGVTAGDHGATVTCAAEHGSVSISISVF
jgi:hypothetical protein